MSDINNVTLVGRMTGDPEVKSLQSGTSVCSFSLAVNYTYSKDGEKKEQVSFFNCSAWSKRGEIIAQYFKKGDRIGIVGRLVQDTWEDQDGKKRSAVKINVDEFMFLNNKKTESSPANVQESNQSFNDDNIPF